MTALDPSAGSDSVVVLLLAPGAGAVGGSSSSAPLLQATIKMPVSEPEEV